MTEVHVDIRMQGVERLITAAGPRANTGVARALNRAGAPTATAELRAIRRVLGLKNNPRAKISLAQALKARTSKKRATSARLEYSLAGWGAGLPLIYYQPKETPRGASVWWLGARKIIPRAFYLSGKFPRRKASAISHSVWRRTRGGRWALDRPKGPGVPEAMMSATAKAVWQGEAAKRLPGALEKELTAIILGLA